MTTQPVGSPPEIAPEREAPFSRELPVWAVTADAVSVALAVVGVLVGAFGGFRLRNAWWRVEVTSPYRVWLWAVVVALARHLVIRRPPIHARLDSHLRRWGRAPALRAAATVVVSTRGAIFAVGLLAVVLFGYRPGGPPWRESTNELVNLPMRWDAGWYLQIAEHGYTYVPTGADRQQNIVFFPAYPVLVKVAALLLGNSQPVYSAAATIVSLAAFLFGLAYLYLLTRELVDEEGATATLWMLASYPFALFYGAIYTESLFLLVTAGAFYHFRRGELLRAGGWGLLAGLTRPNGGFLALPLALVAIGSWLPAALRGGRASTAAIPRREPRHLIAELAVAAMCGVGTLAYAAYIWAVTGDPLTWASGHAAWGRHYEGLTELATSRYEFLRSAGLYEYIVEQPYDLINGIGDRWLDVRGSLLVRHVSGLHLARIGRRATLSLRGDRGVRVLAGDERGALLYVAADVLNCRGRFGQAQFEGWLGLGRRKMGLAVSAGASRSVSARGFVLIHPPVGGGN
jgi:hypothetical protein